VYLREVTRLAKWSEDAGCEGILVYTDNGLVDPWLVAQVIVENTERLSPLVAVQPVYLHPYSVAKMIATISYFYRRRLWINFVAGGFKNDLTALGDDTDHDRRYDRIVEYAIIIKRLLEPGTSVSFEGEFYRVRNLKMTPPLEPELAIGVTISGSSDEGLNAARKIGALAVQYPRPVHEYESSPVATDLDLAIRIGIIARLDGGEAWHIARERFPEDRTGQLTHQLAMRISDSAWHKQLSDLNVHDAGRDNPYWLLPFENYKTFCPYLVGDYETVAAEVARYMNVGYGSFILDVPASPEELEHIGIVFDRATKLAR
jgi:alkanesulfonate monooxygenase